MSENKKPIKVEFAPGAFDSFDGTQQELEELVAEIQNMFANLTPEELAERSRPISIDDLEELDEEDQAQILSALSADLQGRKLQ